MGWGFALFFFLKLEAFDWCMIQKDEKLAVFWDFLTFHYLSNKKKFIGKKNFYWLKKNWRKNFTGFFFPKHFPVHTFNALYEYSQCTFCRPLTYL